MESVVDGIGCRDPRRWLFHKIILLEEQTARLCDYWYRIPLERRGEFFLQGFSNKVGWTCLHNARVFETKQEDSGVSDGNRWGNLCPAKALLFWYAETGVLARCAQWPPVIPAQSSVRKGEVGRPSLLNKLPSGLSAHA